MAKRFPNAAVLLTLGSEGAEYYENGTCIRHHAFKVNVVDTTAAGDTFLGFFVARAAIGDAPEKALHMATAAAALAVSKEGAAQSIPSLKQVLESL